MKPKTVKLVLLRHGESVWNKKKLFTGWMDIDLSVRGISDAKKAGRILKKHNFHFDKAYTSSLTRAVHTLWLALEEMKEIYIPIINAWQLNERHYGGLTGLNKLKMAQMVGADQVHIWRRSYDVRPPKIDKEKYKIIADDPRYKNLKKSQIPWHESLEDTCRRAWPYWQQEVEPKIIKGEQIIIAAHGNSLRGIIMHLEKISEKKIPSVEIPCGVPLVYELSVDKKKIKVIKKYYLTK